MRKTFLGVLLAVTAVLFLAVPAGANVIPGNPRVGSQAITRMGDCFEGPVTFTITGNGVNIVLGTVTAGADGWAELEFTVPDLSPGTYNMNGRGASCWGDPNWQVNVTFVIRAAGSGNEGPVYPLQSCGLGIDRFVVRPAEQVLARATCFQGTVQFSLNGTPVGSASANAQGTAELAFSVPNLGTGYYVVAASGTSESGEPLVLSTSIVLNALVDGPAPTPAPALPTTPAVVNPGTVDVRVGSTDAVLTGVAQPAVPTQVLGAVEQAPTVAAAQSSRSGILAFTGSDTGAVVRLAVVVMLAGGVLLLASRRRSARV